MTTIAIVLSALFGVVPDGSSTLSGKVVEVIDGNTFILKSGSESTIIVLDGLDCPEKGQPYYEEASKCLRRLVFKKAIVVEVKGLDRKGNTIGRIAGVTDPQHTLLREGLAWPSDNTTDMEYLLLMQEAKEKQLGVWSEESPTPPWIYRRQQSMLQPKSS